MKYKNIFTLIMLLIAININAENNENNHSIISTGSEFYFDYEVRKLKVDNVLIGELATEEQRNIYDFPRTVNSNIINVLQNDEMITVHEVMIKKYKENDKIETWIKISFNQIDHGWLKLSERNPYLNNRWDITDNIKSSDKMWTIRKYESQFVVFEKLNITNKPGINGTEILYILIPDEKYHENLVHSLYVTEETDTIDNLKDRWIYITDEQNREGWIFGGYAHVERGGPKYHILEDEIRFSLGGYP